MILEIFDVWENLAWAEFIPLRAFLAFFCKIPTPVRISNPWNLNLFFFNCEYDPKIGKKNIYFLENYLVQTFSFIASA